jgi:hypothetical protein
VAAGLVQVSFARASFGLAEVQASATFTDRTALAALMVTAFAACVGSKNDVNIRAETRPANSLKDFFTCSAYALNLKTC